MSASPADSPQSLYQVCTCSPFVFSAYTTSFPQKSSGRDIIPIILDSSHSPISTSDLAERVNHDAGLLANPGISAALLSSMSGYGKSYTIPEGNHQDSSLQNMLIPTGYEINNPSGNMYLAYTQGMNPPHMHAHSSYSRTPAAAAATTAAYASSYGQRSGSQDSHTSWETTAAPQIPEIISWSPKFGNQGTKVQIVLRCTFVIDANSMNLEVRFGNAKSSALTLTPLTPDGPYYQYKLLVDVPAHNSTAWHAYEVPITLDALDHSGNVITSMKLDEAFSYTTTAATNTPTTTLQASPVISRKRRFSNGSEPAQDFPAKRVATMPITTEPTYKFTYDQQSNGYIQSSPHMSMAPHYSRATSHPADLPYASPGQLHANPTSQPHRQPSPHSRSWSSSTHGALSRSPSVSAGPPTRRGNTMAASSGMNNPRLVRTSQISQSPSPASTPSAAPPASNFNPYAMYPHKAQLKISGELDSMTQNWTPDERHVKRRLVQFWRSQTGSAITATFAPVAPEERKPNAICISCIWWEAKDQYYVTSVDTIFLLESLVAVRFTVEEKNRIRRNLEGFRPMTVSKGKSDSEDFFKLIMGFPNPKPRNIEKDVKVYSWKILTLALKKIIGKYVSLLYFYFLLANNIHSLPVILLLLHPACLPRWILITLPKT